MKTIFNFSLLVLMIAALGLTACSSGSKSSGDSSQTPVPNPPLRKGDVVLSEADIDQLLTFSGQPPMAVASEIVQLAVSEGDDPDSYAAGIDKVLSLNCNDTACVIERK